MPRRGSSNPAPASWPTAMRSRWSKGFQNEAFFRPYRSIGRFRGQRRRRVLNVSSWSIRNPIPAILFFILLTLAGVMAFKAMKVQQFPDIDLPTVIVTASLPGAAPAQMETEVARKIENALATVQGLKHLYSKVQDGTATITAEFRLEKPTQEA